MTRTRAVTTRGPGLQPRQARRTTRRTLSLCMLVLAGLLAIRLWPHAPLSERIPTSTAVWSADGDLLRVTLTADEQYRMWVPLSDVSSPLTDAFLLKEDRWFFWHPGVNPVALVRAATATYVDDNRQGGSTITMQLARLIYGLNTRSPKGKAQQIAASVWLELRYSKTQILEGYLNAVPFGGNIQGVGAASRLYFGKGPDRVNLAEAMTLAVIPQRPASRTGRSSSEQELLAARQRLGKLWLAAHGNRADDRRQIDLPVVAERAFNMPRHAPHFVDALLASRHTASRRIDTTLDSQLQQLVELHVARYLAGLRDVGVHNAAALLVDTRDTSVKAWVGSADYWNEEIDGQVNGVLARRSPGSALKPFIYGLAFDQGVIHPQTVLRDAPTAFGPFSPENFDGAFFGPVTAQEALIRSRNVPAVWVTTQLNQPTLYDFLRTAGVRQLKPESFYGLALALGGGEVSMEELAEMYAMLANGGVLHRLHVDRADVRDEGVRLLSPEASFMTLDVLRRNPRPDDDGMVPARTRWPVAWKTGTSWGFRDAWSAGVAGPYVLVVWVGNFDGRGNPAFIGVDAAAPLFFRIADALNLARAGDAPAAAVPPAGVSRIAVCTGSGDLPNADCPHTVDTWYIPGKSPIRVSQLHRAVAIDTQTGTAVCPPYPAATRFEVFEFWTSDMLELFRKAGMPRRAPPSLPDCTAGDDADAPRISSPLRNVSYALRRSTLAKASASARVGGLKELRRDKPDGFEEIALEASVAGDVRRVFWFDGRALIGVRAVADGAMPWRPDTAGVHLIRVVDDRGRSAERDVDVQFTP